MDGSKVHGGLIARTRKWLAGFLDRALEAVTAVNETIDKMGSTGELKTFNRAFKEPVKSTPLSDLLTLSTSGKRRCWRP